MGKRILVADDSLTIQKAFAMVMDGSEYVLSFARSVDEALAAAKATDRPDLILSDVALGAGSGYDLCAEIKSQPSLRDVPVYILASNQTPYDEARGRKVGADGHLAKPFESQALLDAVASALTTARPISSVMPQFSADFDDNTARISNQDLPDEDDDSYGEIIIERSPAAPAATSAWGKLPSRPSAPRPLPAAATPPAAATVSPRPSLIPGARPPISSPASAAATSPYPTASGVPAAAIPPIPAIPAVGGGAPGPRPPMNRTMMGFPSVKPPVVNRAAPPLPARATPSMPMPVVPSRPMAPAVHTPPAEPVTVKAPTPLPPTGMSGVPPIPGRPPVPRFSIPTPPAGSLAFPGSQSRPLPAPPSGPMVAPQGANPPPLADIVSSAVDRKIAAVAARGPEYEAIAKLSREIIEQVVWEVVPELAEAIIRQEVDRLASVKK